jgi:hypothetical protein
MRLVASNRCFFSKLKHNSDQTKPAIHFHFNIQNNCNRAVGIKGKNVSEQAGRILRWYLTFGWMGCEVSKE